MMDLYIDKENLLSLARQLNNPQLSDKAGDCLRMIKRQINIKYNFEKKEIEDLLYQLWFNNLVQGRGDKESSDTSISPPFPNRPIKTSFFEEKGWKAVSSVYLCTDPNLKEIRRNNRVLISEENRELYALCHLFWGDYSFTKTYALTRGDISYGWKELELDGHCLPCSDIMIVDRYLFANPTNLKHNLYPLIRRLTHNVKAPVNVILFVERASGYSTDDFDYYCKDISKITMASGPQLNVTIVVYPPSMKGDKRTKKTIPHDRFILTNYRLFYSGPSFGDYFDEKGQLSTNGMNLTVDSLANNDKYGYAYYLITTFQDKVINRILRLPDTASYIFGKKKSNMFVFS